MRCVDIITNPIFVRISLQVNLVLESAHPAEVKEQALCIVGNIASGAGATDYVMNDDRILHKLLDFMVSSAVIACC